MHSSLPMTRELCKELLIVLACSWDPWIPEGHVESWGIGPQCPLVASGSYTTDANLMPSPLYFRKIYLFIVY